MEPKDLPLIGEPARTDGVPGRSRRSSASSKAAVTKFEEENKNELAGAQPQGPRRAAGAAEEGRRASRPSIAGARRRGPWCWSTRRSRSSRTSSCAATRATAGRPCRASSSPCSPASNAQPFKDGSGRLELAQAIASKDNPLTARVIVNRVWLHHFGARAWSRTPSDFGLRSEPPTHPELLDYLAVALHGGRLVGQEAAPADRAVERPISRVAAAASTTTAGRKRRSRRTALLWRMNRRRLDFEAHARRPARRRRQARPRRMGGPAVDHRRRRRSAAARTLYGFIDRQNLPGMFRTFDFASPDADQPAALPDDGAAAGAVPAEQPVRAGAGPRRDAACRSQDVLDVPAKIRAAPSPDLRAPRRPDEVRLGEQFLQTAQASARRHDAVGALRAGVVVGE